MAAGLPAAFFLARTKPASGRLIGSISHTVFACGAARLA